MHLKAKRLLTVTVSIMALAAMLILDGCAAMRPKAEVDITGTWKAVIETPEGDLEVLMRIAEADKGAYSATVDIPIMGVYDVPLIFSFENGVVHYEVGGTEYAFDGKLTTPSTIEGDSIGEGGVTTFLVYKLVEE